jgi:hypothetical protein
MHPIQTFRKQLMPDDMSVLSAKVIRLIEKWGEAAVVNAVEAARAPRPRGPKPMNDYLHLMNTVSIMLEHIFQGKSIDSDRAVRIYIDRIQHKSPKHRIAMMKRLRRKTSQNWFGVIGILCILYEVCIMQELTPGHRRYLLFVFSNWWSLREQSRDPAVIADFWGAASPGDPARKWLLGPFGKSRFADYNLTM